MSTRTYLTLPVNADEGFPQSFLLVVQDRPYRMLLYVDVLETEDEVPAGRMYELPEPGAFLVMQVTREIEPPAVIFHRKVVRDLEYEAHELAFVFRIMRVARRNLNGVGAFGSQILAGVALR